MKFIILTISFLFAFEIIQAQNKSAVAQLQGVKWVLTSLNDKPIEKNDEGMDSFVEFVEDASFKGFAGCNKFQGKYTVKAGKISCVKIGATKMECENSNNEQEFIKALEKSQQYKINNNELSLKDSNKTIAIFSKIESK
jgi:putative lipoprotein